MSEGNYFMVSGFLLGVAVSCLAAMLIMLWAQWRDYKRETREKK